MALRDDFTFEGTCDDLTYRLMNHQDEELVKGWIAGEEWQKYWEDPETEWGYYLDDFASGALHAFIIEQAGAPIGLIQYWHYAPNRQFAEEIHEIYLRDFPDDTVGIDISIGAQEKLGAGIGARAVRHLATALNDAGAPLITIDPDASNLRAIKAYKKAGFRHHKTYRDTYVMVWKAA